MPSKLKKSRSPAAAARSMARAVNGSVETGFLKSFFAEISGAQAPGPGLDQTAENRAKRRAVPPDRRSDRL
jgi:hypothetical protein